MPLAQSPSRLAALCAVLLLAGCATVGPDYQRPTLDLPAAWQAPQGAQTPDVLSHWWQRTEDAQLIALVDAALA
ncbi:MAG: hypothetical protein KDE68_04175, partial [Rhodocyclaceae bacterium]|nr:hypothetical protein [Rhodocyclaceae bacterium]